VSQHISRKELKKDQFKETLEHGAEYALSHTRMLWLGGTALVVVLLAAGGWRLYSDRQTLKATSAFEDATKTFEARIRIAGEPEEPGEVTYVDEKNKFADAQKKFREVAKNYSLTAPGRMARYYEALCSSRLGQNDQALKELGDLAGGGNADISGLARFQMAEIYDQAGKPDEAAKQLKLLIDKPSALVSVPMVKLQLAAHYRKTNPAEAARLYQQVKKDFPDTQLSEEADRQLGELGPKS
jgi:hypothetical protein